MHLIVCRGGEGDPPLVGYLLVYTFTSITLILC